MFVSGNNRLFVCIMCIVSVSVTVFPETLRTRADSYFSGIEWADSSDKKTQALSPAHTIPGGTETFPLLKPSEERSSGTLYPETDRLGRLDYSELPAGLRDFLKTIASALKSSTVPNHLCLPEYPFLPVVVSFQLSRLPAIREVAYSRPVSKEAGVFSVLYRFTLDTGSANSWCYAEVRIQQRETSWYIREFDFDGASYAEYSRQN